MKKKHFLKVSHKLLKYQAQIPNPLNIIYSRKKLIYYYRGILFWMFKAFIATVLFHIAYCIVRYCYIDENLL